MTNAQRKITDTKRRIASHVHSIVNDIEQGITVTKDDIEGGYYDYDYKEGDTLLAFDYTKDALETTYLVHKDDLNQRLVMLNFATEYYNKWDDDYFKLSREQYNELLKSNPDHRCEGFAILVAFGGPNIWINTKDQQVEGFWWGDNFTLSYNNDEMGIHDCLNEFIGC